jgi:transcriptional regulator with XRE-family HTH domain
MTLGSKVKEIREAKGWSQGRLAKYSGLTRSYLSRIELDHYTTLGGKALVNLSAALGVTEDVLLEASGLKPVLTGKAKTEFENFTAWLAAKEPSEKQLQKIRKIIELFFDKDEDENRNKDKDEGKKENSRNT